jgi:TPR repeat protein
MIRPWAALIALTMMAGACLAQATTATDADKAFGRGLSAFNSGDFKAAFEAWGPLAEAHDARAEAGIGFMYHKGLGTQTDNAAAAMWFQRAADQGQPEGQLMLGLLYLYGTGVPQSYIHALAWCQIAQDFGQPDGQFCRDMAISYVSEADMRESYHLIDVLRLKLGLRKP